MLVSLFLVSAPFDFFHRCFFFSLCVNSYTPFSSISLLSYQLVSLSQAPVFKLFQRYVHIEWVLSLSLLELRLTAFSLGFGFLCSTGSDLKIR